METPKTKAYMDKYMQEHHTHCVDWGYWEAYRARRVNNHHCLMEFAEQLMKKGYECYMYDLDFPNECCKIMSIRKGDMSTNCGFAEVPYRWYIGNEYNGLVKGLYIGEDSWNFPLEVEEVEAYLKPIDERFKDTYRHKVTEEDFNF